MRVGLLPRHSWARFAAAWSLLAIVFTVSLGFAPNAFAGATIDAADAVTDGGTTEPGVTESESASTSDATLFFLDTPSLNLVCAPARAEAQVTPPCSDNFPQLIEVVAYCDERGASMLEAPFAAPVADMRIEAVADCQADLGFSGPAAQGERDGSPAQPPAPSLEPADLAALIAPSFLPVVDLLPDTPYTAPSGIAVERGVDRPPRRPRG